MKLLTIMSLCLMLAFSFASSGHSQSSDPGWLDSLRSQMAFEQDCEVAYFLNIREREEALGVSYSARVQCVDGRQFDARRGADDTSFTIETCGVAVCGLGQEVSPKA